MSRFERRALLYKNNGIPDTHMFFHQEIAGRLVSYIKDNDLKPQQIANFGCEPALAARLSAVFPDAALYDIGLAEHSVATVDLAVSNLSAGSMSDVMMLTDAFTGHLKPGGSLIFSIIAAESFTELVMPGGMVFNSYPDIKEVGDFLHAQGFSDIVMHREIITLTYERLETLLKDIRVLCAPCARPQHKGLRTASWFKRWVAHMNHCYDQEKYSVSVMVLYGRAKLFEQKIDLSSREVSINIADIGKIK